jgi:hypothetical protein
LVAEPGLDVGVAVPILTRPQTLVGVALLGLWAGTTVDVGRFTASSGYRLSAALILAIGLVASTSGISLREVRENLGTVLLAVTFGVVAKAAIIAGIMFVAFRQPSAVVLGVVVAQIDPLSVAAMRRPDRLSARGGAILSIWAAFDDPVTILLTIYASAFALRIGGAAHGSALGSTGAQLSDFTGDLARNALFVGVAVVLWFLGKSISANSSPGGESGPRTRDLRNAVGVAALGGLVLFGAWNFLMLGLAVIGLFFRPALGRLLDVLTRVAFLIAVFIVGLLVVRGVDLIPGIVLGIAACLAHAVVSIPISRGLTPRDRRFLAVGQQNGVTALILAVLLERDFPGTVGIVTPAIVTIGVIYALSNGAVNRYNARVGEKAVALVPVAVAPVAARAGRELLVGAGRLPDRPRLS